jgi:hypothetical protein
MPDLYQTIRIEADMLQGNVNRMIITNEVTELNSMKEWAIHYVNSIYEKKLNQLSKGGNTHE